MDLDLTPEHELVRRTVREFAETRVAPVAEELDREGRFPYELVGELAELGLMGIPIPEEYEGAGGDTLSGEALERLRDQIFFAVKQSELHTRRRTTWVKAH